MNRRSFLHTMTGSAAGLAVGAEMSFPLAAEKPVFEADWLALAQERIEKHRRGNGVVVVRDTRGKPVPGAVVSVEQQRHDFLFGCNFFCFNRLNQAELENQYRERFAAMFNYCTLGFYWPMFEPRRGQPIYSYMDQVAAWCAPRGITCKGHPLAWDFADPRWLPRDFSEIADLSHTRVREIITRYKGQIDLWDVVNEPTHLGRFNTRMGEWAMSLGAIPYVTEHLKIARQANPKATLLVNDYRTDPPFYKILEGLRENGKLLFDAIGIQSHMHGGGWGLGKIWEVCDTYGQFQVPVHFTETTIVSGPRLEGNRWGLTTPALEEKQADYVPKFYTMLFAHPAMEAITWWDFSDNRAWQGAAAGWVRNDMSPKPVYDRMMELIKKNWWTKVEGITNEQGELPVRAFFGEHLIKVKAPNHWTCEKKARWQRHRDNRVEVVV